jgi:octaprenyl-diphosphate synthase
MSVISPLLEKLPPVMNRTMSNDREAVEAALESIGSGFDGRLGQATADLIRAGGKRLRPLLSCAVLRAFDEDPLPHMELIACVEVIHAASLLHDDVVDGAATRRGRETAHERFGPKTAVMAGDAMMARALEILSGSSSPDLVRLAARTVTELARGQILESEHAFDTTVPLMRLLTVNRLKTGALFAYAAESAAILAGAPAAAQQAASRFGGQVGEAFQLVDDLIDWSGREEVTGKAPGRDLQEGKTTVPLHLAMRADPGLERAVRRCWTPGRENGDRDELQRAVVRRVARSGALDETRIMARELAAEAAAALQSLQPSPWRDELARLALRSVDRAA